MVEMLQVNSMREYADGLSFRYFLVSLSIQSLISRVLDLFIIGLRTGPIRAILCRLKFYFHFTLHRRFIFFQHNLWVAIVGNCHCPHSDSWHVSGQKKPFDSIRFHWVPLDSIRFRSHEISLDPRVLFVESILAHSKTWPILHHLSMSSDCGYRVYCRCSQCGTPMQEFTEKNARDTSTFELIHVYIYI